MIVRGRRTRSAWPVVLVLALTLLVAAAVVADRLLLSEAEGLAARRLQGELGTPTDPRVDIEGVPFLSQAALGRFGSVRLRAEDVPAPPDGAGLERLDLTLRDVRATDRFRTLRAGEVQGTSRLSYAEIGRLLGQPVGYAEEGRVRVDTRSRVGDLQVDASVVARPVVDVEGRAVTLADPEVTVNGRRLPDVVGDTLVAAVVRPAPLAWVPLGLTVRSLQATPDGLEAGLDGRDVLIQR